MCQRNSRIAWLALAACTLVLPLVATPAAQEQGATSGARTYEDYCAVCHGKEGKGDGPAAAALKTPPTDLTALAKKNGGTFPRKQVEASILGTDRAMPSHGSVDMPIWGPVFNAGGNEGMRVQRIDGLLDHIRQLQQK